MVCALYATAQRARVTSTGQGSRAWRGGCFAGDTHDPDGMGFFALHSVRRTPLRRFTLTLALSPQETRPPCPGVPSPSPSPLVERGDQAGRPYGPTSRRPGRTAKVPGGNAAQNSPSVLDSLLETALWVDCPTVHNGPSAVHCRQKTVHFRSFLLIPPCGAEPVADEGAATPPCPRETAYAAAACWRKQL